MATKAEQARMRAIKDSGCIACLVATRGTTAPDVHHITSGGRRISHMHTIGLCPWHHRSLVHDGQTRQSMSGIYGPSLAFGKRSFNDFFGSEEALLRAQNYVLERFNRSPWIGYDVPHMVRREATKLWTSGRND